MRSEEERDMRARVRDLEQALQHARAIVDAERRRAHAAEESARRAWRVAATFTVGRCPA